MTIEEVFQWLKEHNHELTDRIRKGYYPTVRRVEIPKSDGGMRKLGIPTVIDRIIQHAIKAKQEAEQKAGNAEKELKSMEDRREQL